METCPNASQTEEMILQQEPAVIQTQFVEVCCEHCRLLSSPEPALNARHTQTDHLPVKDSATNPIVEDTEEEADEVKKLRLENQALKDLLKRAQNERLNCTQCEAETPQQKTSSPPLIMREQPAAITWTRKEPMSQSVISEPSYYLKARSSKSYLNSANLPSRLSRNSSKA